VRGKLLTIAAGIGLLCGVVAGQPYIMGEFAKNYTQTPSITVFTTFGVQTPFWYEWLTLDLHAWTDVTIQEDKTALDWGGGGWLGWTGDRVYIRAGLEYDSDSGLWFKVSWRLDLRFVYTYEKLHGEHWQSWGGGE